MATPFIGEIILFAGNFAPRSWSFCDGQILPIASHTALFSLLGTTYGGDGRTTMGLPDLQGRTAIHAGNGPGLTSRQLGAKTGSSSNTIQANQLAAHSHNATAKLAVNTVVGGATQKSPSGNFPGVTGSENSYGDAPNAEGGAGTVEVTVANSTGSSAPVNNLQPYLGLHYIISLQGVYPSRS